MSIEATNEWLRRYKTYLRSPEWKEKRARVLEFWDHSCATCSSPLDLQVHHRTYIRVGAEKLNDLIALCENCHAKFHETLGKQVGPPGPATAHEIAILWKGMYFDGIEK